MLGRCWKMLPPPPYFVREATIYEDERRAVIDLELS